MKKIFLLALNVILVYVAQAQCADGETEVIIEVSTDDWGYEIYWELLDSGNECGDMPLFIGGNDLVGCSGAGLQEVGGGNGYGNNQIFTEGPFCLADAELYDIVFVDDFADGGAVFTIYQNGIITNVVTGAGNNDIFTFEAGNLTPFYEPGDLPCEALEITPDAENLIIDTSEATINNDEVSPEQISCGLYGAWCDSNGALNNTVWVKFTASSQGTYEISTCNEGNTFDTAIAVYSVDDCSDFSSYQLLTSNDDAAGGCGLGGDQFASVCYANCLSPGEVYYIQIDGWQGQNGITELSVSSVEIEPLYGGWDLDIPCPNTKGETGSIAIPQTNGVNFNSSVEWTGPNNFTSNEWRIENMTAGEYLYTVIDACGNTGSGSVNISIPDPFDPSLNIINNACLGATSGSIESELIGGTEPYEFNWSGPENFESNNLLIENLVEGTYFLNVTDENGCIYSVSSVVSLEQDISFSLGEDLEICTGEEVTLQGPDGFYIYNWQDGSDASSFTVNATEFGTGNHIILLDITSPENCTYADLVTVTIEDCVGVEEFPSFNGVYPNPTDGELHVISDQKITDLNVYSADGRLIKSIRMEENTRTIDLNNLTTGSYILVGLTDEKPTFHSAFSKK